MSTQPDIYAIAMQLIDEHGDHAENYATAMLRRGLKSDEVQTAGTWLAIGNAIEDLKTLPPAGKRH